jgi:hypothetical protein
MPTPKRSRNSLGGGPTTGALKTPRKVLAEMGGGGKRHDTKGKIKILQSINSCVITAANSADFEDDAYELLEELMDLDINLNETDFTILDKISGPPLHLAAKLNCPRAVRLLCENGASVTYCWEGKNPIQVRP